MWKVPNLADLFKGKEVAPKTIGAVVREQLQFANPTSGPSVLHIYQKALEYSRSIGDARSDEEIFYIVALEVLGRAGEICQQIHPFEYDARNKEYDDNEPLFMGALLYTGEQAGIFSPGQVTVQTLKTLITNQIRTQSITKVQKDHM